MTRHKFLFPQSSPTVCPICGSRHETESIMVPVAESFEWTEIPVHVGCIGDEPTPVYFDKAARRVVRQAIY